ncbi:hypothetical protein EAKF1_ch3619 [Escherichia albertii KF1]|nr:hypothetical protein EAKF1_ch3619 [Escherichia albertii KF1]
MCFFLRKNHIFKRGLIAEWCINNTSLADDTLNSKFIAIIMLIILVMLFLSIVLDFLF